jgi:uracil-DNA glycosylase family 4
MDAPQRNKASYSTSIFGEMDWFYSDEVEAVEIKEKIEEKQSSKIYLDDKSHNLKPNNFNTEILVEKIEEKKKQKINEIINENEKKLFMRKIIFLTDSSNDKEQDSNLDINNFYKTLEKLNQEAKELSKEVQSELEKYNSCYLNEESEALLDKMISAMKLKQCDYFKSSLISPKLKREDVKRELTWDSDKNDESFKHFIKLVESFNPHFIVTLGAGSSKMLLGKDFKLNSSHGKFYFKQFHPTVNIQNIVVPIFHPEFLSINPSMKKSTWEDLQVIMKELSL